MICQGTTCCRELRPIKRTGRRLGREVPACAAEQAILDLLPERPALRSRAAPCEFFFHAAAAHDGQAAFGFFPGGRAAGIEKDFEQDAAIAVVESVGQRGRIQGGAGETAASDSASKIRSVSRPLCSPA